MKKIYVKPETEVIVINGTAMLLTGSREDAHLGDGSGGYGDGNTGGDTEYGD